MRDGTDSPISRDVRIDNNLIEQFCLRAAITASAGIDARGPVNGRGNTIRDFGRVDTPLTGIRANAGLYDDDDIREPAHWGNFTDSIIEGHLEYDTYGLSVAGEGCKIDTATIISCRAYGVNVGGSASGFGSGRFSSVQNVNVYGSRNGTAFYSLPGECHLSIVKKLAI